MASQRCPPYNGKSTIKYWWIPPEVQSFEPKHIVLDENLCATPTSSKKGGPLSGRDSRKRITISHFRSAAAGIWDCVGQPANLQTKSNCKYDNFYEKGSILCHLDSEKDVPEVCADTKIFGKYFECGSQLPPTARSNFEDLRRIKKMLLFASCNRNINSFFSQSTPFLPEDANKTYKAASIGSSSKTVSLNPRPFFGLTYLMKFTRRGCQAMDESCVSEGGPPSDLSDTQRAENIRKVQNNDLSNTSTDTRKYEKNSPSSLCSAYTLQPSSCTEEAISILRQPTSGLQLNCNIELMSSSLDFNEKSEKSTNSSSSMVSESSVKASSTNYHNTSENDGFFGTISLMGDFSKKPWLDIQDKLQHAFSNNRHAIAGALAGTLVTLCLHPVDTVKTNIQAYGMGQKSFYHILKRIVSQNGMLGLYRGIASNITAAAPISAIYTFTYESVKYALLPLLPKEYHSFAHCIAGGCSSIATSFIFTPSEHIKQQMQVGSQYQNCWNAFIGCLQKGGIPSLYAGWGAVLCRNVPHSIIKFYTYESLKQFLSSGNPDSNLNTFQTLVCGGLAGSTAALFTTPFDVVKTRLQTQAPGCVGKYHGVFHALQEIARQEGLHGLYRGLTPRLAMYVSQGAIFFASYEFLKAVFLLETPKNSAKIMEDEIFADDTAIELQMLPENGIGSIS